MHTQKLSAMSVSALTLLAVLVAIASQCRPSIAKVNVPRRAVKQPIQVELDFSQRSSEDIVADLVEVFEREATRVKREGGDFFGSGEPDFPFANINISSNTLPSDNHTSALFYWSEPVVFILFRGFKNDTGNAAENYLWSLFRSIDSGVSFDDVTDSLPTSAMLDNIWPSPDPNIILFSDIASSTIYKYTMKDPKFEPIGLNFSPDTLLFQSCELDDAAAYGTYILGYDKKEKSLWVTVDIYNWIQLGVNVTSFFWRELNSSIEEPSTVYFDQKLNHTASVLYFANESNYDNPQILAPKLGPVVPNTFSLSHQYMFVQKKINNPLVQESDRSSLWVSFFREPFLEAKFPVDVSGKHYAVIDASEGRVMLVMYSPNLNSSTLFQSDKLGTSYTLSLDNIVVASVGVIGDPVFDVYKVNGLPATYLANRRLSHGGLNYTYITFNSGGRWSTVNPPVVNSQGNLVECHAPCSLHLHLLENSKEISQILAVESAPGFIMALGNVGTHLERNASTTYLYVSHDGGIRWEESLVENGFGYYQVLDYGVYTLFAMNHLGPARILASCDQGRNWTIAKFLPGVRVSGIVTDPKATASMQAIVYGYLTNASKNSFSVSALSFEGNGILECEEDDYHLWAQPSQKGLQSCILGQRHVYERRNLETCCYISENYEYYVNHTVCLCSEEDYECDVGFYRKDQVSTCDPIGGLEYPPSPPAHCPEGQNYSFSSGYRKIAGDRCKGGNSSIDEKIVKSCPIVAPDGLHILIPSQNGSTFPIQSPINFTLIQTQGTQLSTLYTWRFGDNSTFEATGLDNANSTSHTYNRPDLYTVVVVASNDAGKSEASKEITVLDVVTSVNVDGPSVVLVGAQVGFCVSVKTQGRTQKYTPAYYKWMVDGQQIPNLDSPCYSRKFFNQTTFNISVSILNALGTYSGFLLVEVAKVPAIDIVMMDRKRTLSLDDHIPAMTNISFSIKPHSSNQTFPSDMDFQWMFFNESDVPVIAQKSNNSLSIGMQQLTAGSYIIAVTGKSSIGISSSTIAVTVEETINRILVKNLQPGYRQFTNISVIVSVFTNHSTLDGNFIGYSGDVQLELWEERNITRNILYSAHHSIGRDHSSIPLEFPMTVSGIYSLSFLCYNNIPSSSRCEQDVFIADSNQYQYLRLTFNVDDLHVPDNSTKIQSVLSLEANITELLIQNLEVERWQLEVTMKEETISRNETYEFSEDVIVAHVYILPTNLSNESISDLQMVTNWFLTDANNGEIAFYANDNEVRLSLAESGLNSTIQFCFKPNVHVRSSQCQPASTNIETTATPVETSEATESRNLGLLVGLIVGLLCLLLNAIQLIVITRLCCQRRKRPPRTSGGYVQMGKFEPPVTGTFAVKNEDLDEQDVEDDEDDNEDSEKANEEAAFITDKPSPEPPDQSEGSEL